MPAIDIGIIEKIHLKKDYGDWDAYKSYKRMIRFYNCISIEDDDLLGLINETFEKKLPVSYCTPLNKHNTGIDWSGITLIAPDSVIKLMDILKSGNDYYKQPWFCKLYNKCKDAAERNKYMIFFGI